MARVVEYNTTLGGYEQWLYLKDEMVSYIGASMLRLRGRVIVMMRRGLLTILETGKAKGFYTDTECQGAHSGIVSAHGSLLPSSLPPYPPLPP